MGPSRNCQFSSYAQCMATASGLTLIAGSIPDAFAREQRAPIAQISPRYPR